MSLKAFARALLRRKYLRDTDIKNTKFDRCLTTFDLTFLGVGSTLGLGIYVLAGQVASIKAGPAVAVSFLVAAIASVFAALCYAEFGARVPKAGSAYVYSYVTVGEVMAFIIGWNLILEYIIGTASVARGYSGYLDYLLNGTMEYHLKKYMPMHLEGLSSYPDFLSFGITVLLSVLLGIGVKESATFNNIFTGLNLLVVLYAVITGMFKANIHNWELPSSEIPAGFGNGGFLPYGFSGMMAGASMCFYGYIGFDCIATTGEEVKNPQKSIPISIILSLFIVFMAYFGVSVVQTLMWPYYDQNKQAPLPYVFQCVGWTSARWIISIGALAGLSTSLLGAMFPLPRVLSAMASDGLIFKWLADVHPTFKTPFLATMLSGAFAGVMAMMFNVNELAAMMSIGTLLAYTLVAISVLILRYRILDERIHLAPLLNTSPSPVPLLESSDMQSSSIMAETNSIDSNMYNAEDNMYNGLPNTYSGLPNTYNGQGNMSNDVVFNDGSLASRNRSMNASISTMLMSTRHYTCNEIFRMVFNLDDIEVQSSTSSLISIVLIATIAFLILILDLMLVLLEDYLFRVNILAICSVAFMVMLVGTASVLLSRQPSERRELSFRVPYVPLVPILSVFVNIYLMMKLSVTTWIRFGVWMFIGFLIYFGYGMNHSIENFRSVRVLPSAYQIRSDVEEPEVQQKTNEHSPLLGVS